MKNLHIHAYDDVRDCIRDCMFEHLDKHIRDNYSWKHVQVPVQSEVLDKVENTILFCVVIHIHAGVQAFEFN
jgi:hypothetical protein